MQGVHKEWSGSQGGAGALQGARGVRGAGPAAFPDREPQLVAPATQHQVSPGATAAYLPGVRQWGQGEGPPHPPPALALQGAGQADPLTWVSALPHPPGAQGARAEGSTVPTGKGGETGLLLPRATPNPVAWVTQLPRRTSSPAETQSGSGQGC